MRNSQVSNFTLDELTKEVARRLEASGLHTAQRDARVSAAPEARTIRYYTTLGLLDTPVTMGRQAQYGTRHILQLLAIKALQGASLTLGEIQQRLYGRTDEELEAILKAVSAATPKETEEVHTVWWREVVIEPGLKLLADESWTSSLETTVLEERIRAALAALQASTQRGTRRN